MTYPTIDDYTYNLSPRSYVGWDVSTGGANNAYMYKSNGTTVGGEGPTVQYNFITQEIQYANALSGMNIWRNPGSYADPANNLYVGYQRDEVYRFGIVFFNTKGQNTFVKFIGDVRFPNMSQFGFGLTSGNNLYALGIHFDFNFTDLDSDIVSYQVVRMERTYSTATVVDCGYVGNLYSGSGSTMTFGQAHTVPTTEGLKPGIDPSGVTSYRYLLEYICPETNYNKNNYAPYERLDTYTGTSSYTIKTTAEGRYLNDNNATVTSILPIGLFNSYKTITNSTLFSMQSTLTGTQSFQGFTVLSRSMYSNAGSRGYKGTTMLLHIDSDLLPTSGYDNQPHYVLRRRTTYPYGGYTESALSASTYSPCSPVTPITTVALDVWGGDTYISNFEYMRVLWADATGSSMSNSRYTQIVQAIVESKLNLNYTVNERWSKYDDNTQVAAKIMTADYTYMGMQETAGVHPFYLNGSPALYFTQDRDLYTYNPVYSMTSGSKEYLPKPFNYTENTIYPTRVYKSLVKINGETTDSWLQFLPANYRDIDNQFGDLTRLYNHNNTMFFFQDKAFGVVPVLDREVITASTGASTVIGTGGVLERFDYVSTNAGTTLPLSITGTDRVLYFVDSNLKKICSFNGESLSYLSDSKGVYSYITKSLLTNVYTTYNPKSKEVLFCLGSETTPETLVFNEYTDTFVGFSSTLFTHGMYSNGYMYVIGSFTDLYSYMSGGTLGTGSYGRYSLDYQNYATNPTPSTLELVVNPMRNVPVISNLVEFATEYYLNGTTSSNTATFSTIRMYNNYQDTGTITLTSDTNTIRRFRTWRYNQLRDTLDSNTEGRLIDNYARMVLSFTNDETSKLVVNDITTVFSPLAINKNS